MVNGPFSIILPAASPFRVSLSDVSAVPVISALAQALAALPRFRSSGLNLSRTVGLVQDPAEEWLVSKCLLSELVHRAHRGLVGSHASPPGKPIPVLSVGIIQEAHMLGLLEILSLCRHEHPFAMPSDTVAIVS